MSAKLLLLSHEVKEQYTKIRALHNFDLGEDKKPWLANITIDIKDGKAAEVQAKVETALKKSPLKASVVTEGHRLQVGIPLPIPTDVVPVDSESLVKI